MGILSVWISGPRACHDQPCLLASGHDVFGTAVQGIKGHEISAFGRGPGSDPQPVQLVGKDLVDCLKLGSHNVRMKSHMLHHAVDSSEESHMTQLIYLVMADGLDPQLLLDIHQVVLGGGDGGDARAWETDL